MIAVLAYEMKFREDPSLGNTIYGVSLNVLYVTYGEDTSDVEVHVKVDNDEPLLLVLGRVALALENYIKTVRAYNVK